MNENFCSCITGDKFSWGKYTNVYAILDAANSSTFCSFNIYVMRKLTVLVRNKSRNFDKELTKAFHLSVLKI